PALGRRISLDERLECCSYGRVAGARPAERRFVALTACGFVGPCHMDVETATRVHFLGYRERYGRGGTADYMPNSLTHGFLHAAHVVTGVILVVEQCVVYLLAGGGLIVLESHDSAFV